MVKKNIWYSSKEQVLPEDGSLVICATWYDGWNYFTGHYTTKYGKPEIEIESERIRFGFDDFECWMMIDEPNGIKL